LALAVLLALIAAGGAGYVAWQQWQQGRDASTAQTTIRTLGDRVATLETTVKTLDEERRTLRERLRDADDVNRGMREELLGQNERLRNLDDAVAQLSEKSLSGHDAMLLDEAGSLLRMGRERYTLFHDAAGAAAAYALADQALAGVSDGAFAALRQSVAAEREALEQAAAAPQEHVLQQLQTLRGELAGWPLRPLDAAGTATPDSVWGRVGQALSSVISIERDDGAPLAVADARLARQLLALDLAQAQAALLAHDAEDYRAALQRAEAALASQFDGGNDAVQRARGTLADLLKGAQPGPPVTLGAALTELRNLRAVHALKPTTGGAPAGATP
jgi:uroporphyrin-3 C-methyltransferase